MNKPIAMMLTRVTLMTIGTTAFSAGNTISLDVTPSKKPHTTGYTFSSGTAGFTCDCNLARSNDVIRVFLDVSETRNGKTDWYQHASLNFTSDSSYTLSYDTKNKVRSRTYGYQNQYGKRRHRYCCFNGYDPTPSNNE